MSHGGKLKGHLHTGLGVAIVMWLFYEYSAYPVKLSAKSLKAS